MLDNPEESEDEEGEEDASKRVIMPGLLHNDSYVVMATSGAVPQEYSRCWGLETGAVLAEYA